MIKEKLNINIYVMMNIMLQSFGATLCRLERRQIESQTIDCENERNKITAIHISKLIEQLPLRVSVSRTYGRQEG